MGRPVKTMTGVQLLGRFGGGRSRDRSTCGATRRRREPLSAHEIDRRMGPEGGVILGGLCAMGAFPGAGVLGGHAAKQGGERVAMVI